MFENHQKCRIWIFNFGTFPSIFVLLNVTYLVTLFDCKLQVLRNETFSVIFKHCGLLSIEESHSIIIARVPFYTIRFIKRPKPDHRMLEVKGH